MLQVSPPKHIFFLPYFANQGFWYNWLLLKEKFFFSFSKIQPSSGGSSLWWIWHLSPRVKGWVMGKKLHNVYEVSRRDLSHSQCFLFTWSLALGGVPTIQWNKPGDFPGSPVVKILPSSAGGTGLIPGRGTRVTCAMVCGKKKKKNKPGHQIHLSLNRALSDFGQETTWGAFGCK